MVLYFIKIENEIVEVVEPMDSPTEQDVTEDYSDIDCHHILSIAGKL